MLPGDPVTLRPPRDADLALLASLRNDVGLQAQLLAQPRPSGLERVREWVSCRASDPAGAFFVIAESATDEAAGYVQLTAMDPWNGHAELGICLGPAHQGKGFGQAALALLEGYARRVFGLRKLVLRVRADNARAVAAYRARGFREVGVFQDHFRYDGGYHDVALMEKALAP